jgi:hypothetical protein
MNIGLKKMTLDARLKKTSLSSPYQLGLESNRSSGPFGGHKFSSGLNLIGVRLVSKPFNSKASTTFIRTLPERRELASHASI